MIHTLAVDDAKVIQMLIQSVVKAQGQQAGSKNLLMKNLK